MKEVISVALYILVLVIVVKGTNSIINDIWNKRLEKEKKRHPDYYKKNGNNL